MNFRSTDERQRQAWSRMYRALVEPAALQLPEVAIYVDADSDGEALQHVKQAAQLIGYAPRTAEESWRIHAIRPAIHLLDTGESAISHLRIFEKGINGDGQIVWIRAPYFVVREPLELMQLWSNLAHWKFRR
jgi:PAS domain-containing protein